MAKVTWATDVSGDFGAASDWFGDAMPGPSDDAILLARRGAAYTMTGAANATVNSIATAANATPVIAGHLGGPAFTAASYAASGSFVPLSTTADGLHVAPAAEVASPTGFNLNVATGQDASGVIQTAGDHADANWTVTNADNYKNAPIAYTVGPGDADFAGFAWQANGPGSSWITANPENARQGNETFTLKFDLTGYNPADATLSGGMLASDDLGTVYLNGHEIAQNNAYSLKAMGSNGAGDFVAGVNTLVIQISGSDHVLEAVRLQGTVLDTVLSTPPVPVHWASAVGGNFATASDWTGGAVPGSGNDAILDATGAAFTVLATSSQTVNSIQTAANARLYISGGTFTAAAGTGSGVNAGTITVGDGASLAITGAVDNSGAIKLASVSNPTEIKIGGNASFSGGGQVSLASASGDEITGATAVTQLTNVDNTISGAGLIDGLTLVNDAAGVIKASGGVLTVNTAGQTLTNDGLMEAGVGGTLQIVSTTVDQSGGGTIAGGGGLAQLRGADVIGGTVDTAEVFGASGNVLDGSSATVTLAGALQVMNGASVTLEGSIDNTGLITNAGTVLLQSGSSLAVAGAVDNIGAIQLASVSKPTEIQLQGNASFSGGGQVSLASPSGDEITGATAATLLTNVDNTISGAGLIDGLTLVNKAAGVIKASGGVLTINTAGQTLTNDGLLEASAGGTLQIVSTTVDNSGKITVGGQQSAATPNIGVTAILNIGAAGTTLSGGGQVTLSGTSTDEITGATAATLLTNVDNTISGAGLIDGLTLVNKAAGVIKASGGVLTVNTAGQTLTNDGQMEASAGGTLQIVSTTVDQSGGGTIAGGGGLAQLRGADVIGGTVDTAEVFGASGNVLDGSSGAVTLASTLHVMDGASVTLDGSIDNTGLITMAGGSRSTDLIVDAGGVSLGGGGRLTLLSRSDAVQGAVSGATLTNVDNTISGAGLIDGLTLVNDAAGVIKASGGVLTVNTAGQTLTNDGLMEAVAGGTLQIVSTTVDQSGGGTIAGGGGHAQLRSVDVIGGTVDTAAVFGASGNVLDGSFAAVTVAGVLSVLNGASVTLEGSIDNTGLIAMDAINRSTDVVVGAGGVSLVGGGQLSLRSSNDVVEGAVSGATLTNVDDRIAGGGLLGDGRMILVNDVGGVIVANLAASLTVDTGGVAIQNAGEIGAVSSSDLVVESAVDNTGLLLAARGGSMTVDGDVTGAGSARINGGTLTFAGAFDENVSFGPSGELVLAHSAAYGAAISGFAHTGATSLDLQDVGFAGAGEATFSGTSTGGVLTVVGANRTVEIKLKGDYLGATFTAKSDGAGGSVITDPVANASPAAPAPVAHASEVGNGHASHAEGAATGPEWAFAGAGDHPGDPFLIEHTGGSLVTSDWLDAGMHTQVASLGAEWLFH